MRRNAREHNSLILIKCCALRRPVGRPVRRPVCFRFRRIQNSRRPHPLLSSSSTAAVSTSSAYTLSYSIEHGRRPAGEVDPFRSQGGHRKVYCNPGLRGRAVGGPHVLKGEPYIPYKPFMSSRGPILNIVQGDEIVVLMQIPGQLELYLVIVYSALRI